MHGKAKNYELVEARIIEEVELKTLFRTIEPFSEKAIREKKRTHYINDLFMIKLAILTGLRISEIAGIRMGDIGQNNIRIIGKGDRFRNVPLGKKGKNLLKEFLELKTDILRHPVGERDFLFLNQRRRPYSRFSINKRFKLWVRRSGIRQSLTMHSCRHYFATYLLNSGFNLAEVQKILGHSSATVTSRYLHFCRETQVKIDNAL
jgi:site-specific recombinase XerD